MFSENGLVKIKSLLAVFFAVLGMLISPTLFDDYSDTTLNAFIDLVAVVFLIFCIHGVYTYASISPPPHTTYKNVLKYRMPPRSKTFFKAKRAGFVYIVDEINGPHYKIGRTSNPYDRLKTFEVKLPYKVEYNMLIETNDMYALEYKLHNIFSDKHADGEWFTLSQDDLDWLRTEFNKDAL